MKRYNFIKGVSKFTPKKVLWDWLQVSVSYNKIDIKLLKEGKLDHFVRVNNFSVLRWKDLAFKKEGVNLHLFFMRLTPLIKHALSYNC
jgi:hypothetical protein